MKFQVLQENLSKALGIASRFTSSHAQLPVLGNIMLEASKTKILVSSTNLEISVCISVGAKIEKEGKITVPSKIISELVSNLSPGPINFEVEKERIKAESASFLSDISGMDATDFPSVPQNTNPSASLTLPKEEFSKVLSQVIFASSIDETRPILTGVLFLFGKDRLTLVATDGFRLSQKKMNTKLPAGKFPKDNLILPKGVLGELARLDEVEEEVTFSVSAKDNQVIFGIGETVLSSRILEGEFPDFTKIIPKESTLTVSLDKDEFLRAVKLASVFARDSANVVKLAIGKDSIEVSAESSSSGSQKTKVDAKVAGHDAEPAEALEIAFNYRFLEEFLHAAEGDEIEIGLTNAGAPGKFSDPKDPEFLHLIMPVKIQE